MELHQRTDRRRYFFDTEFMEDGNTIELISIGIVCEDGREYYAINKEADLGKANAWVEEHVISQLPPPYEGPYWKPRSEIRDDIRAFVKGNLKPEFWAYYADYDWVLFCRLFGRMIDLPPEMPQFCMDLKQLSVHVGSPMHPVQKHGAHNALEDARWNKELFEYLMDPYRT